MEDNNHVYCPLYKRIIEVINCFDIVMVCTDGAPDHTIPKEIREIMISKRYVIIVKLGISIKKADFKSVFILLKFKEGDLYVTRFKTASP